MTGANNFLRFGAFDVGAFIRDYAIRLPGNGTVAENGDDRMRRYIWIDGLIVQSANERITGTRYARAAVGSNSRGTLSLAIFNVVAWSAA